MNGVEHLHQYWNFYIIGCLIKIRGALEMALRRTAGIADTLRGVVRRSSGRTGSEGVRRPVEMGLALERWG